MNEFLKKVEIAFRHAVVYPFFRLVLNNPAVEIPLPLDRIKKLLILRADGIGDMLVSTPMFRLLKQANPNLRLAVFASERNAAVIRCNPYVDRVYLRSGNPWKLFTEILHARKEGYDVVINFVFNRTTSEGLLANIVAPRGVKIGQGLEKYRIYFNRLLSLQRSTTHMVQVLATMTDTVFGTSFATQDLHLEVFVDDESKNVVDGFLGNHKLCRRGQAPGKGQTYIVLNFSAVDRVRRMSPAQVVQVVRWICKTRRERPVIIYPPNEQETLGQILAELKAGDTLVFPETGTATLLQLASLIEGAVTTITCDTSIVHFSSASNTPVFVLFTPTAAKNHEWTPFGVRYRALYAKLGDGVSSIPMESIKNELAAFLAEESSEIRPGVS